LGDQDHRFVRRTVAEFKKRGGVVGAPTWIAQALKDLADYYGDSLTLKQALDLLHEIEAAAQEARRYLKDLKKQTRKAD
jgi:hypothetical protein